MIEICERIENSTRKLIEENGIEAGFFSFSFFFPLFVY